MMSLMIRYDLYVAVSSFIVWPVKYFKAQSTLKSIPRTDVNSTWDNKMFLEQIWESLVPILKIIGELPGCFTLCFSFSFEHCDRVRNYRIIVDYRSDIAKELDIKYVHLATSSQSVILQTILFKCHF